jgi:hypothetical protein
MPFRDAAHTRTCLESLQAPTSQRLLLLLLAQLVLAALVCLALCFAQCIPTPSAPVLGPAVQLSVTPQGDPRVRLGRARAAAGASVLLLKSARGAASASQALGAGASLGSLAVLTQQLQAAASLDVTADGSAGA